jgi:hypothetical protein
MISLPALYRRGPVEEKGGEREARLRASEVRFSSIAPGLRQQPSFRHGGAITEYGTERT